MNRTEAAAVLGVTVRQLNNWANEPDFPSAGRVGLEWNVAAIEAWRNARNRKGSEQSEKLGDLRERREIAKLAIDTAAARMKARQLEKMEGKLVPRGALELLAATLLSELSDVFDQFPDLLAKHACESCSSTVCERATIDLRRIRETLRIKLEDAARELDELTKS